MASQILFFRKNKIDLDDPNVSITVTDGTATDDGADYLDYLRNRNNTSAWFTQGSNDAANTTLVYDLVDTRTVDSIILIGMNFASYTLKYWDGAAYQDFATPISVSGNTATTKYHEVTEVTTSRIQLVITGTITPDDDKQMKQTIITEKLNVGQLESWPVIDAPKHTLNPAKKEMLSGKVHIINSTGRVEFGLKLKNWNDDNDFDLFEDLYFINQGVLVWPCGGDESQFFSSRIGYRLQDIYLMRPNNDWSPKLYQGLYNAGMDVDIKLVEVVN